jgi:ABC-type nickel/cobalt efflux system permease component RcnA
LIGVGLGCWIRRRNIRQLHQWMRGLEKAQDDRHDAIRAAKRGQQHEQEVQIDEHNLDSKRSSVAGTAAATTTATTSGVADTFSVETGRDDDMDPTLTDATTSPHHDEHNDRTRFASVTPSS